MKVLYIEDNEKLAYLVCALLEGHGYQVEHYVLGKLGLERFKHDCASWDVVIIDLDLPDVSGRDLIPEIAAQRPNLPIVVYSGESGLRERFELYSSGASALLSKPTPGQDLLDVLKHLVDSPPTPIN